MAVIGKLPLRPQTLILQTRTNQNVSSCTKLYRRIVPQTRPNKKSIVNETLSQNYSAEVEKLCSTEIDKSKYTHVPNFNVSNVFKYRRNNPDVSYERVYMATEGNEYFTDIRDILVFVHSFKNVRKVFIAFSGHVHSLV